jgi:hypothetical protein
MISMGFFHARARHGAPLAKNLDEMGVCGQICGIKKNPLERSVL